MIERPPLPTDAAALPPLGPAFERATGDAAAALGVDLGGPQLAALEAHARLLLAWNEQINLTAIREPLAVARLHVADSLTAVPLLRERGGLEKAALLDLGSGAGYPGFPLAIALPIARVALVDSVAKKVRFLEAAAGAVQQELGDAGPEIEGIRARAEELARTGGRERWDIVTVRAVGSLADVAELGLPLLRRGGLLVAWKRDPDGVSGVNLAAEVDAARAVIAAAGGGRPRLEAASAELLPGHVLVSIEKSGATPARFPRDPAARQRRARS